MAISIVNMTSEEEARGKARVHWLAWKEAYHGLVDQAFLDARTYEFSEDRALRAFHAGIPTLLAKDGDEVVGFADYGPYRGNALANTGEVYALYLLSSHYRRGIGTALMEAALARMPQYSRHAVWVLEGNERAIAFYRSCGFAFDGARQTLTLGTEVTDLRMIRS